jgi:hypothetical protein
MCFYVPVDAIVTLLGLGRSLPSWASSGVLITAPAVSTFARQVMALPGLSLPIERERETRAKTDRPRN